MRYCIVFAQRELTMESVQEKLRRRLWNITIFDCAYDFWYEVPANPIPARLRTASQRYSLQLTCDRQDGYGKSFVFCEIPRIFCNL